MPEAEYALRAVGSQDAAIGDRDRMLHTENRRNRGEPIDFVGGFPALFMVRILRSPFLRFSV
jgi:hypothetical protein